MVEETAYSLQHIFLDDRPAALVKNSYEAVRPWCLFCRQFLDHPFNFFFGDGNIKSSRSWLCSPNSAQFMAFVRILGDPSSEEKWLCARSDLDSCVVAIPDSPFSVEIKDFFFLILACKWKNFVLVSPFLIHVNLECWRALAFCIAAMPTALDLRYFLKSTSSVDKGLDSWALSRFWRVKFTIAHHTFQSARERRLQCFRAFAVRKSLTWILRMASWVSTGLCQVVSTVSLNPGMLIQYASNLNPL